MTATSAQLQTEDAKVSAAVENKLVDQLPLVVGGASRSPFDLVGITPEAKGTGTAVSLGGGEAGAWSATLDGLPVNTNRSPTPARPPTSRRPSYRSRSLPSIPTASRPNSDRRAVA